MPANSEMVIRALASKQREHGEGRAAHAEALADQVREALAGRRAHARAHLLHDGQADGDEHEHPEQAVAVLRADAGRRWRCRRRRCRRWRRSGRDRRCRGWRGACQETRGAGPCGCASGAALRKDAPSEQRRGRWRDARSGRPRVRRRVRLARRRESRREPLPHPGGAAGRFRCRISRCMRRLPASIQAPARVAPGLRGDPAGIRPEGRAQEEPRTRRQEVSICVVADYLSLRPFLLVLRFFPAPVRRIRHSDMRRPTTRR